MRMFDLLFLKNPHSKVVVTTAEMFAGIINLCFCKNVQIYQFLQQRNLLVILENTLKLKKDRKVWELMLVFRQENPQFIIICLTNGYIFTKPTRAGALIK